MMGLVDHLLAKPVVLLINSVNTSVILAKIDFIVSECAAFKLSIL